MHVHTLNGGSKESKFQKSAWLDLQTACQSSIRAPQTTGAQPPPVPWRSLPNPQAFSRKLITVRNGKLPIALLNSRACSQTRGSRGAPQRTRMLYMSEITIPVNPNTQRYPLTANRALCLYGKTSPWRTGYRCSFCGNVSKSITFHQRNYC